MSTPAPRQSKRWALPAILAAGVFAGLPACSSTMDVGSEANTAGTGTSGARLSTGTTGHRHATGGIATIGGGPTSAGSNTIGGGSTTSGVGSNGGTSGMTGGTSSASATTTSGTDTGSGASGGGTGMGGTTSYVPTLPYQGYDSGWPAQPELDSPCPTSRPYHSWFPGYDLYCVQCRTSDDCPSPMKCGPSSQCVDCLDNSDCPSGELCNNACSLFTEPPYRRCVASCQIDCRDAGADFCLPGICDGDAGGCLPNVCYSNADCVVDGRGACDSQYGFGVCAPCTSDGGGCGPDEICLLSTNDSWHHCQPSCQSDAGSCPKGSYCSDAGTCALGCQTSVDCAGSTQGTGNAAYSSPICSQGQCVSCLTSADCPDYNPGCGAQYQGGVLACGYCTDDLDCPGAEHCERNKGTYYGFSWQCACHADSECPLDAPVCVGLNADAGFPAGSGRCACTDSNQCPQATVCETRFPYAVYWETIGPAIGGACIASCSLDVSGTGFLNTDCATAGISDFNPQVYSYNGALPPPANVCNYSTGYCVSCAEDTDCPSPENGPLVTPVCVPFPNGIDPISNAATGGGQCGCSDTSQCDDGYACWQTSRCNRDSSSCFNAGSCQPACATADGVNSCDPLHDNFYYDPPLAPICNTFSGACVQCLSDYDCTNVTATRFDDIQNSDRTFPAPFCDVASGQCIGCRGDSDCPSTAPKCTFGACGDCNSDADCNGDAGFSCVHFGGPNWGGECLVTGCVADDSELATDAGATCPAGAPYCSKMSVCNNTCTHQTICAQCRYDMSGDCGPPFDYSAMGVQDAPPVGYCQQDGICFYN